MYSDKIIDPENTLVKAGVGLIITNPEGEILLERRSDNGRWGLPGGGMDPGESVTRTAVREAMEETGLAIRVTELIGVYSDPADGRVVTYPDNQDVKHLVDTVLGAEVLSGEMKISEESLELKWFEPGTFPEDLIPPARRPLEDFVNGKKANIR